MADGDSEQPSPPAMLAGSWQTAMFLGAATVILGLIVALHPTGSVNVIAGIAVTVTPASSLDVLALLLGVWFMVMGVFEIIGGLLLRHAVRAREMTHA
jgi:uncharacterized membrane protein HdeD (DUF308 family)